METVGIYANWKGGGLSVYLSLALSRFLVLATERGSDAETETERGREKRERARERALKLAMTRTDNPLGSVYLEYNIYLNANQ